MVAFRIGELQVAALDDEAFSTVLEVAAAEGGPAAFPTLFGLLSKPDVTDPMAVLDDLARLAATPAGRQVAMLIGSLRDDLMEALAAAEEG
ncbi:MAG: hypothetical protein AB7P40_11165 [Chloroflexota bacterium]